MKVKNILFAMFAALSVMAFTSCQTEEDDIFSDSSSNRLQQDLQSVKEVLRGAKYGWAMDYYFGDDQSNGGTYITIKFDSLTCTAASELVPEETTSYYKLTTDQGPVLTFDTYNMVLHSLATPSQENYEGYHADFEFVVMSAQPDLVVLRGKKIGNYAYLRPLDKPALDYIGDVVRMQDSIYVATATGHLGSDSVMASFDYGNRIVSFTYSADSAYSAQTHFVFTDKGLRMYSPVEVAGLKISEMDYKGEGREFTCVNDGAQGFVLNGNMPADYLEYDDMLGDYWLHFQRNEDGVYVNDSAKVTLTANVRNRSYIMSGVNDNYTIAIGYDRGRGCLTWNSQVLCTNASGNEVWAVAASLQVGGTVLIGTTGTGMETEWNGDRDNIVLNWKSNTFYDSNAGADFITDSWCLWEVGAGATTSIGQIVSGQYLYFGRQTVLNNVTSMVKIN